MKKPPRSRRPARTGRVRPKTTRQSSRATLPTPPHRNWKRQVVKGFLTVIFTVGLIGPLPVTANREVQGKEVAFMRDLIGVVNPALMVEDDQCAVRLPWAIQRYAAEHDLDWQHLFVLAWQESHFDCHAKNPLDRGGSYGPFQIRRLWHTVTGDPRHRYYNPELAVERVSLVLKYYLETERYQELVRRRFKNPLLCLYNTGEIQRVNMNYCRKIGKKLSTLKKGWDAYLNNEIRIWQSNMG